jgi:hypothetical protein
VELFEYLLQLTGLDPIPEKETYKPASKLSAPRPEFDGAKIASTIASIAEPLVKHVS